MPIGLFIDGAFAVKSYGGKIDFLKLRQIIEAELNDTVDEAYYFSADDNPPTAEKMHNYLSIPYPTGPGFRVKLYWLQKKKLSWPPKMGGQPVMHPTQAETQYELISQKGVDVGLIFHLTRSYYRRKWTKLVLVAGDGDFHEPVQNFVESDNVDLYIFGSLSSISQELRPYARKVFEIDKEPMKSQLTFTAPVRTSL